MGRVPTFSIKWKKSWKSNNQGIGGTGVKSVCLELEVNPRIAEKRLLQGGFDLAALTPLQGVHMAKRHRLEELLQRSHSHRKRELGGIKWSCFHSPRLERRPTAPAGKRSLWPVPFRASVHRAETCVGRDLASQLLSHCLWSRFCKCTVNMPLHT